WQRAAAPQQRLRVATRAGETATDRETIVAVACGPKPTTATGVNLIEPGSPGLTAWMLDPSPSWPPPDAPQHFTPPVRMTAQLWRTPAANAATPVLRPDTPTGAARATVPSSPTSPKRLSRQHL